jgi:hypothetical protein
MTIRKAKTLSDQDLEILGKEVTQALQQCGKVWTSGMRVLKLTSPEYRNICKAGKNMQQAYVGLWALADERNWSEVKLKDVFGELISYSFN